MFTKSPCLLRSSLFIIIIYSGIVSINNQRPPNDVCEMPNPMVIPSFMVKKMPQIISFSFLNEKRGLGSYGVYKVKLTGKWTSI